jgi:predicted nuclease of predicted toxin-antitoxin system
MKLLVDECVWYDVVRKLRLAGHDAMHVTERTGWFSDLDVLEWAQQESRTLITMDKGFGELAIRCRLPHCGIIRLAKLNSGEQYGACIKALKRHGESLQNGAIVTVSMDRIRYRPPAGQTD